MAKAGWICREAWGTWPSYLRSQAKLVNRLSLCGKAWQADDCPICVSQKDRYVGHSYVNGLACTRTRLATPVGTPGLWGRDKVWRDDFFSPFGHPGYGWIRRPNEFFEPGTWMGEWCSTLVNLDGHYPSVKALQAGKQGPTVCLSNRDDRSTKQGSDRAGGGEKCSSKKVHTSCGRDLYKGRDSCRIADGPGRLLYQKALWYTTVARRRHALTSGAGLFGSTRARVRGPFPLTAPTRGCRSVLCSREACSVAQW